MVGVVARPELVSDDDHALGGVFLHGPGALEVIFGDRIKEMMVEDALISVNKVSLLLGLDSAEVDVAVKLKGSRTTEALEALVSADLMKRSHLESTDGDDLALLFNGVDQV